jgi:aryl-alcohol dehydrogenase-like predicted oxidoreductase
VDLVEVNVVDTEAAQAVVHLDEQPATRAWPQLFDSTIPSNRVRLDAVEQLAKVADEAGLKMIQLALGFVTTHPAVTSALIGPRTMEHLHSQLAAADTVLSADILDAIVAPGTDLAVRERIDTPRALLDPSLRRR